jgi:hypothetical protein
MEHARHVTHKNVKATFESQLEDQGSFWSGVLLLRVGFQLQSVINRVLSWNSDLIALINN